MRPGAGRDIYIYIYIYKQVRLHGYPGGVFVGHRPPGTRVAPCKMIYKKVEVLHLFRWYTHTYTHKQAHNGPDTHTHSAHSAHAHTYLYAYTQAHSRTNRFPGCSSLLLLLTCAPLLLSTDAFLGRRYRVGLSGPIILNINTHFALPCFACVVLVLLGVADSKCF